MHAFKHSGIALSLLISSCTLPSGPAYAQACGPHAEGMELLARNHQEFPVFQGLSDSGTAIQVFASATGSYTVVAVMPNGMGCVLDTGQAASVTSVRRPESKS